jgi:hypothetical protein
MKTEDLHLLAETTVLELMNLPDEDKIKFINYILTESKTPTTLISDGYHTFDELYQHRNALFIGICTICYLNESSYAKIAWKSRRHDDGELAFNGEYFVLGLGNRPGEMITYHLPISYWEKCELFAEIETSLYDGHTSDDVLKRLGNIL